MHSKELNLTGGSLVICDLHLDPVGGEVLDAFVRWVEELDVPTLVILGDLFDVWVGPSQGRLEGSARVLTALKGLADRETAIEIIPGNRDFLMGANFEARTGARIHPDGFVGLGADQRVLFVHGDELCTKDHAYQRMKRVLRSGPMRWVALHLPLSVARWAAGRIRRVSTRSVPRKPAEEKSMQADACRQFAGEAGAGTLVCGHAHVFRDEELPSGPRWIVLDGWGGDQDALRIEADGALAACTAGA